MALWLHALRRGRAARGHSIAGRTSLPLPPPPPPPSQGSGYRCIASSQETTLRSGAVGLCRGRGVGLPAIIGQAAPGPLLWGEGGRLVGATSCSFAAAPFLPPASRGLHATTAAAQNANPLVGSAFGEYEEQPPRRTWCPKAGAKGDLDVLDFPPERVRNFSIVAHVDHGKSTLADRLMEMSNLIDRGSKAQFLDKLQVERERGITVKAQTVSMVWRHRGEDYLLNLIDTPGHVDFSYEVSRSLAACQGALLLVDAGQGIQAQTVANFFLAFEQDLTILPVVNKVDVPAAEPERVREEMMEAFSFSEDEFLYTSGKTGLGLEHVLPAVIERVKPPGGDPQGELRMLLFDCYYDEFRGVVVLVEVVDGHISKGDKVQMASTGEIYEVLEIGLQSPGLTPTGRLFTGQVGYVIMGMKSTRSARVGDTLHRPKQAVPAVRGFKAAQSMVFAGLYPVAGDEFETLAAAIDKLTLNDASVSVAKESSQALGAGFRCGFLGLLHMDVFHQRLENEYGTSVIATAPTVPFRIKYADNRGDPEVELRAPGDLQADRKVDYVLEPTVKATIVAPKEYVGALMTLCSERRGQILEHSSLGGTRVMLKYVLPMGEIATNFYDELKSCSSGYASFDYEEGEWQRADLVRLDMQLNGLVVDALARIVHRDKAVRCGKDMAAKLKEVLPRQQFEIAVQAAIGTKVIARETINAYRKNVLAKCYGGDVSRKKKLLSKQKEGKKRMRRVGSVDVPQEAFHSLLKTS